MSIQQLPLNSKTCAWNLYFSIRQFPVQWKLWLAFSKEHKADRQLTPFKNSLRFGHLHLRGSLKKISSENQAAGNSTLVRTYKLSLCSCFWKSWAQFSISPFLTLLPHMHIQTLPCYWCTKLLQFYTDTTIPLFPIKPNHSFNSAICFTTLH